MSNRRFIDDTKLKFFDAPLKTVNENYLKTLNSEILKNNNTAFGAALPHFYNKVAFVQTKEDSSGGYSNAGGVLLDTRNGWRNSNLATFFSPLGRLCCTNNSYFDYPNLDDWIIYYHLKPVKEFYWQNIPANPPLYVTEQINTGFKLFYSYNPSGTGRPYTPVEDMGQNIICVRGSRDSIPSSDHSHDNWLYVDKWVMYNRKQGSQSNRVPVGNRPSDYQNVFPISLWDMQNLYWYSSGDKKKVQSSFDNFQAVIMLNPFIGNGGFGYAPHQSLRILDNWVSINTNRISDLAGRNTLSAIYHNSTLGDNIKFLGVPINGSSIDTLAKLIDNAADGIAWYAPTDKLSTFNSLLAFKTENDFLNLLADWGINRATNNETDAQTIPSELLPDNGGFVPSGGDSTGYNDNSIIPNIPSFPDNTSDIIEIFSPNISSANAASVYALTLTSTQNFLKWLMTDSFIDNISNLFTDKLSALNDLKLLPFDIVNHDTLHTQNSAKLTLANVSTDIQCFHVLAGYNCILDGGKYKYTAYWGNFNDYTAATYYLYIPYGGVVEMSPSHVVNCEITIKYAVDLMTGNATAIIYSNDVLVKTIPCQMAQPVPITFTNTNQRDIKNALTALSVVNGIGNAVASGATGNIAGAVSGGIGAISGVLNGIANNPLKIGSVGNFSNSTAFIMPQNAFLIISRVQLSIPSDYSKIAGIPSNIYTTISSFAGSGFVQINVSHINTAATTAEQQQIIDLLRGGIFI